jgi:hypothetical protein
MATVLAAAPRWEDDLHQLANWTPRRPVDHVEQLARALYDQCYVAEPPWRRRPRESGEATGDLGELLSAADHRADGWSDGWTVEGEVAIGHAVRRGSSRAIAVTGRYVVDAVGTAPKVGDTVSLFLPKGSRNDQPGFYVAYSTVAPLPVGEPIVRLYWRVRPSAASGLLSSLTQGLDHLGIPFAGKWVTGDPARTDPVVVYLRRADVWTSRPVLRATKRRVADQLVDPPPLFTRRVCVGLAWAEDPDTGLSFGESRCRAVAAGLWEAWGSGADSPTGRTELVRAALAAADISPLRPHRSLG